MSSTAHDVRIGPQPGPQRAFNASSADIVVYGGGAGGGKTYGLGLESLRHVHNPEFRGVIFRREYPQITNPGGMWDDLGELYRINGAHGLRTTMEWKFPSGAVIKFAHMQREDDRFSWDGAQIPFIAFDQLEHFTWKQFVYMLSRNRTTCGVRPYIRATCNPDPDHWLRAFIAWWLDEKTGLAIPERSGVVRWYILRDDVPLWGNSRNALLEEHGEHVLPKSFTFIASTVFDNKILLEKDPGYLANLEALSKVERERLLGSNWNVRESAGMYFRRDWWNTVKVAPGGAEDTVRYWDRAASEGNRGSATAGVKIARLPNGLFCVLHVHVMRGTPLQVRDAIRNIAEQDGVGVQVGIEQDPGQAGKAEAEDHIRNLAGFVARANIVRESKGKRAEPYSAQVEARNVSLVQASWNEGYIIETENFDGSDKCASDQTDASSGAFYMLTQPVRRAGTW